jgi:hypothetical protein
MKKSRFTEEQIAYALKQAGLSEFLCVRRFLNLPSCCSARREGEAVFVQYRELVHC